MRTELRVCQHCGYARTADTFQGDWCAACALDARDGKKEPVGLPTHRRWKAAQGRAMRRLAREYHDRYRELLEEEKER